MKKILQIKKGEYLLEVVNGGISTTYKKEDAFDISNWSMEQLANITVGLQGAGYTKYKILTIQDKADSNCYYCWKENEK